MATRYPVTADVKAATVEELLEWDETLPEPVDDIQRSVLKRIKKRLFDLAAEEVRKIRPDIADQWNEVDRLCRKLGLDSIGRM